MPGLSVCLIILDIWEGFECASGIRYAGVLKYSYNNIIIILTDVLEFLSTQFVHPSALQLTILSFLTRVRLSE